MARIKELKNSLLLTALYTAVLLVFWYFEIPCLFKEFLGINCPGCGMSRAVWSVLRLDFAAAFYYHPMVFTLPVLYLYFLFGGRVFNKKWLDRGVLAAIAVGFFVTFIVKNV